MIRFLNDRYRVTPSGDVRPKTGRGSQSGSLSIAEIIPIVLQSGTVGNLTVSQIEENIKTWIEESKHSDSNSEDVYIERLLDNPVKTLTSNDLLLWKPFRWFLSDGRQIVVQKTTGPNTYSVFDPNNRIYAAICNIPERREFIESQYIDILRNGYSNRSLVGLLVWDVCTKEKDGKLIYPRLTLSEYYEESKEYFLGDSRFQISEPRIISGNPDIPAFLHVNPTSEKWDMTKHGDCPTIDNWIKLRFPNDDDKDIFRAYVCSIFDEHNESRQGLCLVDEGQTGKSVILNALSQAVGDKATATLNKKNLDSEFVGSMVYGKRLVIIGDNKNPNIIQSGIIHNILGGDKISVMYKFQTPFMARVCCRMIIGANIMPEINTAATHERSRLLVLTLINNDKLTQEQRASFINGGMEAELIEIIAKEFPIFIHKYHDVYKRMCPTSGNIILSKEKAEMMYSDINTDEQITFDYIVDKFLVITHSRESWVPLVVMTNLVKTFSGIKNNFLVSNFKKHLETVYKLKTARPPKKGGKRPSNMWRGVEINLEALSLSPKISGNEVLTSLLTDYVDNKDDNKDNGDEPELY